jgi:citrate lyase subunit beta/citryl-CoA lyase
MFGFTGVEGLIGWGKPMQTDDFTHDAQSRLERTTLFVPASSWSMIKKGAASAADAVCLDLEDSVAIAEKAGSRATVIRALTEIDFGRRTRMFRINGLVGPYSYRDVIEVVEAVGKNLDLIMIPKVESAGDIDFVDRLLTQVEENCGLERRIGLEAQIETASGFLSLPEIARSSRRLEALTFGPGDYAASMQMPSSGIGEFGDHDEAYPGHRWHAVMHAIVASARANGLRCVDGPFAPYRDAAGLQRACRIARAMGFDGKQCIHPDQLACVNTIFSPSADEVAHAEEVVRAYEAAVSEKRGAISLNGKMIDAASVRIAKVLLNKQRVRRI